jgi:RNA-directed DNA polymerase
LGTPQGGPLSPWLADIRLEDLDQEWERRGHRFVRDADDLAVLVKSPRAGERGKDSVTRFLTQKLKRGVHAQKSRGVQTHAAQFLGFNFRGTKLRGSDRAFEDCKPNIRKPTGRSWGVSMAYRFRKLAQSVRGWRGSFGISDYYRPIPELDPWLRRRVRM